MEKQAFMARFSARMGAERAAIEEKVKAFSAEGCADDAMLERIRLNICDALEAVVNAGAKRGDMDRLTAFCQDRFQSIPAVWQKNLERAIACEDDKTRAIEEIKLHQAERIKQIFAESRGDEA